MFSSANMWIFQIPVSSRCLIWLEMISDISVKDLCLWCIFHGHLTNTPSKHSVVRAQNYCLVIFLDVWFSKSSWHNSYESYAMPCENIFTCFIACLFPSSFTRKLKTTKCLVSMLCFCWSFSSDLKIGKELASTCGIYRVRVNGPLEVNK